MITNENTANQIGDVLIFRTPPIFRLYEINGFTDSLVGVTGTAFFDKQFAYSLDGIIFTDYQQLTNTALQGIKPLFDDKTVLVVNFRYERIGTDQTNPLIINSVNLVGIFQNVPVNFQLSSKTIFADFVYDNIDVWNLAFNIAQKMYEDGIIPTYMIRNEKDFDLQNDKDYIDFWEVVAKFFGMILIYCYNFTNIYWRNDLLKEYLIERGIIVGQENNLVVLQLIAKHYFDEIRQRATTQIFRPAGYEYQTGARYVYESPYPAFESLRPALPVMLDGNVYREVDELPDGWVWLTGDEVDNTHGLLISPDKNYHEIFFVNDTDGGFTIAPLDKQVLTASRQTGIYKKYDGEYLRLIDFKPGDEFIFNVPEKKYMGWCIGNSSPCYKGLRPQYNLSLIKVYDIWQ